jgi:hypothetical protein
MPSFISGASQTEFIRTYEETCIMKHKMIALILALTVMSWAQTATPTAPSTPQQSNVPADKKCPCCDKLAAADTKDTAACCARNGQHAKQGKEMASCCAGTEAKSCCSGSDAKSCVKNGKDNTAACCGDTCSRDKNTTASCSRNCGKDCQKDCCSTKKNSTIAKNCCEDQLRSHN